MIQCEHVSKYYGQFHALKDIRLTVREGECLALFGENGSGKSTLLSILAGAVIPDEGNVQVDSTSIQPKRTTIAYIPQNIVLFEELTVWENMLSWSSASSKQAKAKAEWLCDSFDMQDFKKKRVDRLSGGQRRRVNTAVSLMNDFDYLLLDEPLSGMDLIGEKRLSKILRLFKEEGKGIIIAEHHIDYVLPFADHVIELKEGSVQYDGGPEAYHEMVYKVMV